MPQQHQWQVPQRLRSQQCQADKEEYKHRTIRNQIPLQRMIFGKRRAFHPPLNAPIIFLPTRNAKGLNTKKVSLLLENSIVFIEKEEVIKMAEVVANVGVKKEKGYLYFLDGNGNVCRAAMSRAGRTKGKAKKEVVARSGVKKVSGYLYFIDKKGNVARAKMARGRKAGTKKAAKKKTSKKKAAKKKTTKRKPAKRKAAKKKRR